jgi:SecD/SecF fusion protein
VAIVCDRLRALGIADGEVRPGGRKRIRVLLPGPPPADEAQRVEDQLGATAQLRFYDWETNLIGPERTIGGHPGRTPKASVLSRAKHEWSAAGRGIDQPPNARLILAGAFPNAYGAVKLASRQKAHKSCAHCSASSSRFYVFDRSATHELIAGPVADRAGLRGGIVLKVPVGTAIVSEQPTNGLGAVLTAADPGWYALKDRPVLTGADIVNPKQEIDEFGSPNVTFGFTAEGRVAFEQVTRTIALRGRAAAPGQVTARKAERFSGHFALVFDDEVKTRPIINFAYFPNGIDGRTGAQIAGGFANLQEARDLATILRTGALPIDLTLVRQRTLPGSERRGGHSDSTTKKSQRRGRHSREFRGSEEAKHW